jgi:lysophospholipase L1-like esterase
MKLLLTATLLVLSHASVASAYDKVVCFADSIANSPTSATGYCARLQELRPDLVVENRSVDGRNTVQALSQVQAVVKEACGASSCLVLVHHGVNDQLLPESDARDTAKRLRSIWSRARGTNRDAWILTPLPFDSPTPSQNAFVRDVGNAALAYARRSGAVFDARDVFSIVGWLDNTTDGVHPNAAGADMVAAALADAIP